MKNNTKENEILQLIENYRKALNKRLKETKVDSEEHQMLNDEFNYVQKLKEEINGLLTSIDEKTKTLHKEALDHEEFIKLTDKIKTQREQVTDLINNNKEHIQSSIDNLNDEENKIYNKSTERLRAKNSGTAKFIAGAAAIGIVGGMAGSAIADWLKGNRNSEDIDLTSETAIEVTVETPETTVVIDTNIKDNQVKEEIVIEEKQEVVEHNVPFVSTLTFDERVDLYYKNITNANITREMVADVFHVLDGNPLQNDYTLVEFLIMIDEVTMATNDNAIAFQNITGENFPVDREINIIPFNLFTSNERIAPLYDEINELITTILTIKEKSNPEVIAAAERLLYIWATSYGFAGQRFEMTNGKEINKFDIANPGDNYIYHRTMLNMASIIQAVLGSEFGYVISVDADAKNFHAVFGDEEFKAELKKNAYDLDKLIESRINQEEELNFTVKQFNFNDENQKIMIYPNYAAPREVNYRTIKPGDIVDLTPFIYTIPGQLLSPDKTHMEDVQYRLIDLIRMINEPGYQDMIENPVLCTDLADAQTPLMVNEFTYSLTVLLLQEIARGNIKDFGPETVLAACDCPEHDCATLTLGRN